MAIICGKSRSASSSPARLLAETSHDLRQPIQAIGLWVELLQLQAESVEMRAILAKLHKTAQGLEGIIDSLLDISRLDMGVVEARYVSFPIAVVQERLAATFGAAASSRGLSFRMRTCDAIVHSDPVLVERILGNFVSNAVHHCCEGGVVVGCRPFRGDLSVEVWDTGPGIPSERFADIFDEFVQLQPTGCDRSRSFGLGLSIVRRMAELLGHEISVASRVGRGSCFRLRVPLASASAKCESPFASADDAHFDLAGTFVVFIEDEQELRDAMALLLKRWGCHAVVATSADDAIVQLASHLRAPDIVISDYRLSDLESGTRAIARIRASFDQPIDAIILSGERSVLADNALARSNIPLLRKPVDPAVIRRHLAQCRAKREPSRRLRDTARWTIEA